MTPASLYQKQWRLRNPEAYAAIRERGKEVIKECGLRWRKNNPDKVAAIVARYNSKNPPRERMAKWRAANPEKSRANSAAFQAKKRAERPEHMRRLRKAWERKNRERLNTYVVQRKTLIGDQKLSSGLVDLLMSEQGNRCPYCPKKITKCFALDHYMPLALGGQHADINIQLTCRTCNARKRDKNPILFFREVNRRRNHAR